MLPYTVCDTSTVLRLKQFIVRWPRFVFSTKQSFWKCLRLANIVIYTIIFSNNVVVSYWMEPWVIRPTIEIDNHLYTSKTLFFSFLFLILHFMILLFFYHARLFCTTKWFTVLKGRIIIAQRLIIAHNRMI